MTFSTGFCILMALMILIVPLPWLTAMAAAAAFHELCHYLAIRLLAGGHTDVRFYSYGARMDLPEMSPAREVLCALAGPIGGLLLVCLVKILPRLALAALVQSAYNLLPIYPLDGGRAFSCLLRNLLSPPKAAQIQGVVAAVCKIVIFLFAIYACIWLKWGVYPLVGVLLIWIRTK